MRPPAAGLLLTGSELLLGLISDAHTRFLARELDRIGVPLRRVLLVGDERSELADGLRSLADCDLVITAGGLGPTHDDLTMAVVAEVTGSALELDRELHARIAATTAAYARRRGSDPALNLEGDRKQAMVPAGATVIEPAGTAPGVVLGWEHRVVCVLPGPPRELRAMWSDALARGALMRVVERAQPLEHRTLRITGLGESQVAHAFAAAGGDGAGTVTTICARELEVEVTMRAPRSRHEALVALDESLRRQLGDAVYAADQRPLEVHVVELLREQGYTIALAESCTAGLVAGRIANVPGSSDVLLGGIVAYANAVKERSLGVSAETIAGEGAVSEATAGEMARGVRRALSADVGLSVTGVAGPGGGTAEKPVGLVHLHCSTPRVELPLRVELPGDREQVRSWSTTVALQLVRRALRAGP